MAFQKESLYRLNGWKLKEEVYGFMQQKRRKNILNFKGKSKSGQATTFIVLGLVIVAVIVLLSYARSQFLFGPVSIDKLNQVGLEPIRDHIEECVEDVAPDYFERIGVQGGYLSTPVDTFRKVGGESVSYLCYNMENVPTCYNRYLTLGGMESQLSQAIKEGLSSCINLKGFAKGATLTVGSLNVEVDIGDYQSIVEVNMPVKIQKGDLSVEEGDFSTTLEVPLGALYGVSRDIIEVETSVGEFDQLGYMLIHQGQVEIDKQRPYPDKLYILETRDDDYIFQFFIQGEPA
ncbi:hypothetical protein HOB91_03440 [Candidatus Woesearchaeota archaeon]|nr:hypothetical protein [Candidatus Woesearchaeota archaeon]